MIPKKIHYCWFGGTPKPKSVLKCIESWKKHCPDYEIIEWSEKNFDISQAPLYVRQAYDAKAWGFVPDYIRLWIVYNYGGIYLDTDVQVIKSFDSLLELPGFVGLEDSNYVALGLGFGAEQGNEILLEHMRQYESIRFMNDDGSYNKLPSPSYTTEIMCRHGFIRGKNEIQYIDGMTIYPPEYFCPKCFETGLLNITDNTFSIHHYDASWYDERQQEEKKNRWKAARAKERKDFIIHIPNHVLRRVLGEKCYERLKKFIKG